MSRSWMGALGCLLAVAGYAHAQGGDLETRMKAMEQKLQRVESENQELRQEMDYMKAHGGQTREQEIRMQAMEEQIAAQKATAEKPGGLTAQWNDAFWLKSADGNFAFHPGGIIEAQSRNFTSEQRSSDSFFLREARLVAEGTLYKDYGFLIVGDFGKSTVALKQAWAEWKHFPWLTFRMGEFKKPFSLESMTGSQFVDFAERSPAKILTNEYEQGAMLLGTTWEKRLDYNLAAINGDSENAFDTNKSKDIVAHLGVNPFAPCDDMWLKGIHLGGSVAYGAQKQTFTSVSALDSGTTFLAARTGVLTPRVVDARTQWNIEGAWLVGPAKIQGEATWVNQGMDLVNATSVSSNRSDVNFCSWYIEGLWVLTGEDAVMNRRHPKKNFLCDGGLGQWELALRYGRFDADDEVIEKGYAVADSATVSSTTGFDNYTGGVNWWMTPNVRFTVDWFHNDWDRAVEIDHEHYTSEDGIITRFQIDF